VNAGVPDQGGDARARCPARREGAVGHCPERTALLAARDDIG
jgi:hypothetical protein